MTSTFITVPGYQVVILPYYRNIELQMIGQPFYNAAGLVKSVAIDINNMPAIRYWLDHRYRYIRNRF